MSQGGAMKDYPVQVGSMLFTIVDPHRGHEVEYNRWYERDHYYAGCLIGPWLFAGSRWVATRALKDLRFPRESSLAAPDVRAGSYLAMYWIHAGHHDDYRAWGNPQAHWLYQNDRGFDQRTHVHTLMYTLDWVEYRDVDPVPLPLALDHRFSGMVTLATERRAGVAQEELDGWLRKQCLPGFFAGSPIASCSVWSPIPQGTAPMSIPKVERTDQLDLQIHFVDVSAADVWPQFRRLAQDLEATGLAQVVYASPWLPTIVGTDAYTNQLW
jgi:hypothetical protein